MPGGDNGGSSLTRIYLFVLVLNLVFPVLGYTFTAFGAQSDRYELDINPDSLMTIGLNLVDGESHNVTYGGDDVFYELVNVSIRARWNTGVVTFWKQSALSLAFNNWIFPYSVDVKSHATNEWFGALRNDTIILDYDSDHNWSRFVLLDGHHVFITPFETHGNISQAIWVDQTLNVTIAKSFEEGGERFNFWRFVGWYGSILIGDQSWGLPSVFSWVLRILGAVSIFAVVMLTRELIGFT